MDLPPSRRRMRAVIGSCGGRNVSAGRGCGIASMLCAALRALILLGLNFGKRSGPCLFARLLGRTLKGPKP